MSKLFVFVATLACWLSPPLQALAQNERGGIVEEIIVTAQKREQSLEEVPISISVMPGEQLQAQGFNNLEEIATFIPGVIAEQGATGISSTVTIRGVSSDGRNTAFEQSAAVFNDGTYYGRPLQSVAGIYDVQQVEVLFGPQPVYFGQSAIAGLVSYKSNRPKPGAMDGYAFAEAGNLAHRKMEGALTVPLGESWAARVGGKFQETDGSRMDSAKAVKANAHQLARLIYAMLTRGEEYVERDLAAMETERRDRQIKHLQRQARHFDLALVPAEQAA